MIECINWIIKVIDCKNARGKPEIKFMVNYFRVNSYPL